MANYIKYNHIYAHFEFDQLEAMKNHDTKAYEDMMWHIIDGIRLYDLWVKSSVLGYSEIQMWQIVADHLRFRYHAPVLNRLLDFVFEKEAALKEAIFAISEKNDDGKYRTPLGLGDDGIGDWCSFVVGIGREQYEELLGDKDALREACVNVGWAVEKFTYAIVDAIETDEDNQ